MALGNGASNSQFISITTPPITSGDLVFSLETFDAVPNIAISISVTGILSSDTEEQTAIKITDQFTEQLEPYAYTGTPVFSEDSFVVGFRMGRTQHISSIWAQCTYSLVLDDNSTGALIKISTRPALMTVEKAQELAAIKGFEYTSSDGTPFTDNQITDLILRGSSQICSFLKTNVAITTYLNSFRGQDNKSVFTKPTPGIYRDTVLVRRKAYINLYTNPTYMTFTFFWNRQTGELNYRPTSQVVNTKSPFDLDNEVHVTFTSGYNPVPEDILWALTDLNEVNLLGLGNVKSLKGGTGAVEFQDVSTLYNRIFAPIKYMRN